jgi:hypothetical protein
MSSLWKDNSKLNKRKIIKIRNQMGSIKHLNSSMEADPNRKCVGKVRKSTTNTTLNQVQKMIKMGKKKKRKRRRKSLLSR